MLAKLQANTNPPVLIKNLLYKPHTKNNRHLTSPELEYFSQFSLTTGLILPSVWSCRLLVAVAAVVVDIVVADVVVGNVAVRGAHQVSLLSFAFPELSILQSKYLTFFVEIL